MAIDQGAAVRLNELLVSGGLPQLDADLGRRFEAYLDLLMRWNARLNLTAIRDQEGILSRHFVESIACAHVVPAGVTALLDFGSGAGLPGIPIAFCRPEISVTLAESQSKKAAFLQEAARTLALQLKVYAGRAETMNTAFDCVAMRAVDRMERAVGEAVKLVSPGGFLVLMITRDELPGFQAVAGAGVAWDRVESLPLSAERVIAIGCRI